MGKISSKERDLRKSKQRRRSRGLSNKYLKPGALAQLRYTKSSVSKPCTDVRRMRVTKLDTEKAESDLVLDDKKIIDKSSLMLSPVNFVKLNSSLGTPRTPRVEDSETDSQLESLPIDILVKILCHLHHDQLQAVFHVSQRIRTAVLLARQFHFNYTTPDRSRKEMLSTMTPCPTEHWPFASKGNGKGMWISSPHTPKAPRHGPRPPSRLKISEIRQVAAALFQESAFPSRCMISSVLPKPLCKALPSNRVL